MPPWQACAIALQLCRALGHAHARRIVHRDVKPANILLSREGRVKVGDFGVAQLAEGSTDGAAATVVGTPRYMAPEQGRGRGSTPATDVYSVGVVLYEMLAGRPPFAGDSPVELALRHLQDAPPPLSPRLPTALVAIAERALAKDPADRYADGAEMADALAEARRGSAARPRSAAARRALPRVGARRAARPSPGTGATAVLEPPPRRRVPARRGRRRRPPSPPPAAHDARPPDDTRPAPRNRWDEAPRRNVNPPARRRAAAALGAIVLLLVGMVAAAVLIGGHTQVPRLTRPDPRGRDRPCARRPPHATFTTRYSSARRGTVIAQRPRAGHARGQRQPGPPHAQQGPGAGRGSGGGRRVDERGARATFSRLGLHTTVTAVAAPGDRSRDRGPHQPRRRAIASPPARRSRCSPPRCRSGGR